MLFAFSLALANNLFSVKDINYLLSRDASSYFKTCGYPILAPVSFSRNDEHGRGRLAQKAVECRGNKYWVTTQVYKEGLPNILKYLNDYNLAMDDIIALCKVAKKNSQKNSKGKKVQ